jgi:hypothetical protein
MRELQDPSLFGTVAVREASACRTRVSRGPGVAGAAA